MACKVVFSHKDNSLEGKSFTSHVALARVLKKGEDCTVQETSGTWKGWYRTIGLDKDGKNYWASRPAMEY